MFLVIAGLKKKKCIGRIYSLIFTASKERPGFKGNNGNYHKIKRRKEIRSLNPSG